MSRVSRAARLAALLLAGGGASAQLPSPLVMPWLCLEVCGNNASAIAADVAQVGGVVNAASFELFNLGAGSRLITNNLTAVAAPVRAAGALALAMVSSYPYPPAFLAWMREVFAAPQPFIDAVVAAAAAHNLSGVNIDFEPPSSDAPTPQDAWCAVPAASARIATSWAATSPPVRRGQSPVPPAIRPDGRPPPR